jgi:hypothetical protein
MGCFKIILKVLMPFLILGLIMSALKKMNYYPVRETNKKQMHAHSKYLNFNSGLNYIKPNQ